VEQTAEREHDDNVGRALSRVVRAVGGPAVLDRLAGQVSGADLTTLLLEVFRRRALRIGPADVLRRYRTDRFVAPGRLSFAALRRAEDAMIAAFPAGFDVLALAPVLPLGTHFATGGVDPRKVVATIRGTEVAADPTNGLALEAAVRRRRILDADPRSAEPVKLAAVQQVTRAQLVSGPALFAHFVLLGVVTAGRDTGDSAFERAQLAEHLRIAVTGLSALGADQVRIAITCWDDAARQILADIRDEIAGQQAAKRDATHPAVEVTEAPERESGRGYYRSVCFKVFARFGGDGPDMLEVGDGGFTDWTARLVGSAKERLLISGYGLERIGLASPGRRG
jgi:hypothetical protein